MNNSMDFKILFITSFNYDLYQATGRKMVETFFKHNPNSILIVCYEGFDYTVEHTNYPNLIKYNLDDSQFLQNWLQDNLDVIPERFGGKVPDKKLDVWNFRASKWFRKIASFEVAFRLYGQEYESLMWIDCDSSILKPFPPDMIKRIYLDGNTEDKDMVDLFYHFGDERRKLNTGFESGVIGFRQGNGYAILNKVFECYTTKAYRKIPRWDDGFVFRVIIEALEKRNLIKTVDLIDEKHILYPGGKKRDAINKGIFADYIKHKKGVHKELF